MTILLVLKIIGWIIGCILWCALIVMLIWGFSQIH